MVISHMFELEMGQFSMVHLPPRFINVSIINYQKKLKLSYPGNVLE